MTDTANSDGESKSINRKKSVSFGGEEEIPTKSDPIDDPSAVFSGMKKKKKKKSKDEGEDVSKDALGDSIANMNLDNGSAEELFGKKKKKKKKSSKESKQDEEPLIESEDAWQKTDRDYTYHELLDRVSKMIKQNNPSMVGEKKQYTMVQPEIVREGSKKTAFINVVEIAKRMNRPLEHLISYLYAELATEGSIDGDQRLIIKGRFQQNQIENVLRRYILEYVQCQTCKSFESQLRKQNRLTFLQCETCGSSRTVSAIKSGFRAQTAKRRLARQ